jgi:DNA-binding MarR family transcriptional regulator
VIRYNYLATMTIKITTTDYRALAALRYRMRLFLQEGDAAARRVGLEPQQYLLMLAVRGLPDGAEATVQTLAERLMLKHNSTVELIDRLETRGYVRRSRSRNHNDRRWVMVELLPRGEELVEQVARQRLTELRAGGIALAHALDALLERKPKSPDLNRPRLNKPRRNESTSTKRRANKNPRPARTRPAQAKKRGNKRER